MRLHPLFLAGTLALLPTPGCLAQDGPLRLEIDEVQTAGICGFRPLWDTPVPLSEDGAAGLVRSPYHYGDAWSAYWLPEHRAGGSQPGALAFDAVHRAMLVRFPTAAALIARRLGEGLGIASVVLELPFRSTELWPEYYREPDGLSFVGRSWSDRLPRWHAVAWALRRPWKSDGELGPTYNANVNGLSYWTRFGAQDTAQDRFPDPFGPAEVSSAHPDGGLDLTAFLTDARYGPTLADRLGALNDQGVLVKKWELYDASYWSGGYEYATATGHRAILVGRPRLVVTFTPAPAVVIRAADIPSSLGRLVERASGGAAAEGRPTAVVPTAPEIRELARRFGFVRPEWMPDWQWARVRELNEMGGGFDFPSTPSGYEAWMDQMLGIPPRRWSGFDAARKLALYRRYQAAWPEPLREHWRLYWSSWLQPDRPAESLVQGYTDVAGARAYLESTGDWRGNFSVYRTYCRAMGPMNFNHWAVAGSLIGGDIIGSRYAVEDGRYGLSVFPLHTWSWRDGSTQESVDHYYFAVTLAAQKLFADYGPSAYDRLIGKAILTKSIEELASCFHPGLRRFIATSTRTGVGYLLANQDGLQHIMHALSPGGALTDAGVRTSGGIDTIGHDVLPGEIAQLSRDGPWGPDWIPALVERKALPFRFFAHGDGWQESYLGAHYGVASRESSAASTVPFMAQWRRSPGTVTSMRDLGTLLVRYGINRTDFLDSIRHGGGPMNPNGIVGDQGGHLCVLQDGAKAIVLSAPVRGLDAGQGRAVPAEVDSLQLTAGLYKFSPKPDWEVFVDGRRVAGLPQAARALQRITIRDGVTFLGIIPLPGTDLGRSREVELSGGGRPTPLQGGGEASEALRIDLYNFDRAPGAKPLARGSEAIPGAWAGFAIELSDQSEFPDFGAFQRHFASAAVAVAKAAGGGGAIDVRFESGGDRLEMGFVPPKAGNPGSAVSYRRVNGKSPFPAQGIVRDSPVTQQGTTGRLEKAGSVLVTEPGVMSYLAVEPSTGTVAAFNVPGGDKLNRFELRSADGGALAFDGRIGIAYAAFRKSGNQVWIDQGYGPAQGSDPGRARTVIVSGLAPAPPRVELNGVPVSPQSVLPVTWQGRPAFAVPLGGD